MVIAQTFSSKKSWDIPSGGNRLVTLWVHRESWTIILTENSKGP